MLALILYIIAALCFIAAIALLSFIPNKAVKIVVLILFCLLFISGMTFVLFKVSGQETLGDTFDAMSPAQTGQTVQETAQEDTAVNADAQQDADLADTAAQTSEVTPTQTPASTAQPSPTQTPVPSAHPSQEANASSVVGTWVDPSTGQPVIVINADGTCAMYFDSNNQESGTYTYDPATNSGMLLDIFSFWYDLQTDTVIYVNGSLVREGVQPEKTFSIERMWYDDDFGEYRLEFNPDGFVRYITPDDIYAGTYTFDEAAGQGQIDILGETYGISYHFDTEKLGFDGLTYMVIPPGEVENDVLGMWYEQGDGLGLLEFFPDGSLKYHDDIDPSIGTYIYDEAAAHGDVTIGEYTYEIIYIPDSDTISYEGRIYSRIPW